MPLRESALRWIQCVDLSMAIFLITVLVTAAIGLIVFVFFTPRPPGQMPFGRGPDAAISKIEASGKDDGGDRLSFLLKKKISGLEEELKNEKDVIRKQSSGLAEAMAREKELLSGKDMAIRAQALLEEAKKESSESKGKLIAKDKDFNEAYAAGLKFKRELETARQETESFKEDLRRMRDLARKLEIESAALKEKIKEQEGLIISLKRSDKESEWVSKKDFFAVRDELNTKNTEIEKLKAELAGLKQSQNGGV